MEVNTRIILGDSYARYHHMGWRTALLSGALDDFSLILFVCGIRTGPFDMCA